MQLLWNHRGYNHVSFCCKVWTWGSVGTQVTLHFSALEVDTWKNLTKDEFKKKDNSFLAQREPCLYVWQANASVTDILAATQKTGSNNPSECFIGLTAILWLYRKPRAAAAASPPLTSTYLPTSKWGKHGCLQGSQCASLRAESSFLQWSPKNNLPLFTLLSYYACWNGFHLAVSLDTHWLAWTPHVLQILEEFSYYV